MTKLLLEGKVALITGASRGIGAAVAKKYASLGAHVILVARKLKDLEAVDDQIKADGNGSATLVKLDLRKEDKIDQLTVSIAERFGKLDILVGNAAILGELAPLKYISSSLWNQVMAVNVTANHRLIRNFDPLLRKSDAGRAIFVSSGVTNSIHPFWGVYAVSKAALETLVQTYAAEIDDCDIKVNIIDPGRVDTVMRSAAFPGEDSSKLAQPEDVTDKFVELALAECQLNGEIIKV